MSPLANPDKSLASSFPVSDWERGSKAPKIANTQELRHLTVGIPSRNQRFLPTIAETLLILLTLLTAPASAHKVQIAEDVGGTLHIEPNDNPKAGEPSLAWVALTRKGGQVIPLQECNCKLSVYSQPRTQQTTPLLSPPLKAISTEGYQGIPGASVVFPSPGAYQLQLSGTPTSGADFKPFELKFTVTVAAGTGVPKVSQQTTQQVAQNSLADKEGGSSADLHTPIAIALLTLVVAIAIGVWRRLK
ncbi:hypothetical protein NDI37_20755 [Funiculus sociatus GB2-A5]|uniref:Transketolase n=1 Tax=Funiculus sociatus GB2-A5 TaxID=2933946 RepID=A0ABV0JW45_9CYAN|nr:MULTISPECIES: hypothetical protein [unclassified Trichocoleus]MBD1906740.1 hypothetical protein [Trichocoleus sp. FACHB-832]MBD2061473.1 hypothetical protein [Trichocoleus sp. FACHB-6]